VTTQEDLTAGTTAVRIHLLSCGHVVWLAHPVYGGINHCLSCNRGVTVEHYIDEQAVDAGEHVAAGGFTVPAPEVAPYRVDLGTRWYVVTHNPAGWPEGHSPVDDYMGYPHQPLCPELPVWRVERTTRRWRAWGHNSYYCDRHLPAEYRRAGKSAP
jgi:hypothetical protein